MRKKRNSVNGKVNTEGYIKKYFKTEIGRILVPSTRNLQNCDIPYVKHEEAENKLKECLEGDPLVDKSLVFTGLTGSGKTTILRHVFELEINANQSVINGNTIIIPIDFNRSQSSAQEAILSSLRAAIEKMVELYAIDYPDIDNKNFYEYIKSRRPDFLFLDPKSTQNTSYKEKMTVFLDKMPTPFASCQLQYMMDQPACQLQLVLLIVDNIEAFMDSNAKNAKSRYLAPVVEAFKLAECIDQRGDKTKWQFNMLIACRHHIWRIMKGIYVDNAKESVVLQSYVTTEHPYDLTNPIEVNYIVKKREEVFARKQHDPDKWKLAEKVVNTVLQSMGNSIGNFVTQLELKDLRKSMSRMQELILHKGLQKKTDEEIAAGAFQIDSVEQFDLTRVNLIRTLGLSEYKYYSDASSIIPNLLYNEKQEGIELYVLLTLNYFLIQCDYTEPTWDNSISVSDFYGKMEAIFKNDNGDLSSYFERSVCFLIQHRLLLRSADQPQGEVPGLSMDEMRKIEYVYVSGAAVKLWEELGKSSALFQLFIDDVWIDEKQDYFEGNGNDIEHCVEYLKALIQIEKKIFTNAKNRSTRCAEDYISAFGTTPICRQLLNGLIASLETIVTAGDTPQSRVEMAKKTLDNSKQILNQLTEWEQSKKRIINIFS